MSGPDNMTAAVEAALGRPIDQLAVAEAIDVADRLRAIVTALEATTPADSHVAARLTEAAEVVGRSAVVPDPRRLPRMGS